MAPVCVHFRPHSYSVFYSGTMEVLPDTMDALTFRGKCSVVFERVPAPRLQQPGDAIVRVELCGLCGSDLHPYHCREEGLDVGTVMGHEFTGVIVQAGGGVQRFKMGDRVMSPFTINCGACFYCRRGLTSRCGQSQLFGWVGGGKGLHGAQAQYVRVPLADATLALVPPDVSDEEALLLGDVLSTGYFCAENAGIAQLAAGTTTPNDGDNGGAAEGPVVAVVGCGPVALLAILGARELGAAAIYAIDSVPERLAMAERFGAVPVNRDQHDLLVVVRKVTGGRGADCVLEVVGSPSALRTAFDLVRPGGTISSVGCHTDATFPFSPVDGYNKNITYRSGRCPARHYMDRLLPLVQSRKYDFTAIISHRLPLSAGVAAYHMFDCRQAGCTKVVMRPWQEQEEVSAE